MKNTIKITTFICIFLILLFFASKVLNPAGDYYAWYASNTVLDFYKQEDNTLDVVFVGNSSVYAGVSPFEIYDLTGTTCFSLSTPGQKLWTSYYLLNEVYKTQKPKLIFVEVGEAFTKKGDESELNKRQAMDGMKLSKNKINMINNEVYGFNNFDKLGVVFPIIRYHSRWKELNEFDFRKIIRKDELTYKGYLADKKVKGYNYDKSTLYDDGKEDEKINADANYHKYKDKEKLQEEIADGVSISEESKESLRKIKKICEDNGTELVLFKMPEPKFWKESSHDAVDEFAQEEQIRFLDLNYDETLKIDWNEDTQDGGDHLNIYGAKLVAQNLAKFIDENYQLPDHRQDHKYEMWNSELNAYKKNYDSQTSG